MESTQVPSQRNYALESNPSSMTPFASFPSEGPTSLLSPILSKSILERAMNPIREELAQFERLWGSELTSVHSQVHELLSYVAELGGKRLRPCLLLLSAKSCGEASVESIRLATVVELVHTATLIHDDILDSATLRRHKPTLHHRWNVPESILTGDWLFTKAYGLANQGTSTIPGRWIAAAAQQVCQGEIVQDLNVRNLQLQEQDYLEILDAKTGALCGVSCSLGAWSAQASLEDCKRFEQFGRKLGIAFQIFDDWLDIWGHESIAGKTLGTDLKELKPTLPMIRALETIGASRREALIASLLAGSIDGAEQLRQAYRDTDASEYTAKTAKRLIEEAIGLLPRHSDNVAVDALICLAHAAVNRGA